MNPITCPSCQSENVVKYGHIHNRKQRYICYDCHRQFTPDSKKKYISDEQKRLVDKMLMERLSIAGISRITGISQSWLYKYVKNKEVENFDVNPSEDGDRKLPGDVNKTRSSLI